MDSNRGVLVTQTFLLSQQFITHNRMMTPPPLHTRTHTYIHTQWHTQVPEQLFVPAYREWMGGERRREQRQKDSQREQLCFLSCFSKSDVTKGKRGCLSLAQLLTETLDCFSRLSG